MKLIRLKKKMMIVAGGIIVLCFKILSLNLSPKISTGKLEQFPTTTDNTYPKEVDHREIVTKLIYWILNLLRLIIP